LQEPDAPTTRSEEDTERNKEILNFILMFLKL
jgi:hypothetical protein